MIRRNTCSTHSAARIPELSQHSPLNRCAIEMLPCISHLTRASLANFAATEPGCPKLFRSSRTALVFRSARTVFTVSCRREALCGGEASNKGSLVLTVSGLHAGSLTFRGLYDILQDRHLCWRCLTSRQHTMQHQTDETAELFSVMATD